MTSSSGCPHCGETHRPGARFCPKTGKPLPVEGPKVQPPEEAAGLTGKLPPNFLLCNRYMILRKIGQGGMAAVYQATDIWQHGVLWAIKEMSDAAITNPEERAYAVQAFKQEAHLLQSLNHPNLPKVVDAFTEGGKHYLVIEFVPGQTLNAMFASRTQPFSLSEVLPWALQLCDVLSYLHCQNPKIIFRDLKPSNIMLTPQGQIKLIDFGIVRFFKPGQAKDTLAMGTPGYASPEALSGQTDERSDIYSLCVTLHQLLTMYDPAQSLFSLPAARRLNPQVSAEMEQILARGLQNRRELRWQSAAELRAALARLGWGTTVQARTPAGFEVFAPTASSMSARKGHLPGGASPMAQPAPLAQTLGATASTLTQVKTSRPTTRLLMTAVQLSPKQLAIWVSAIILTMIIATILLAPVLDDLDFNFNYVPIMAIFGALGYTAYPKRGMAFLSQALLSIILVAAIWARLGSQGYSWWNLILGAVLSGAFMEVWVAILPKIRGPDSQANWKRELAWIVGMAVVGTALFLGIVTGWFAGLETVQWAVSAALGAAGWFLGDLLQQYLYYKQTGLWRRR